MAVTAEEFKRALGSFPAGVTVVTLVGAAGQPRGITVSAFSSVSLHPPLVLVCIDRHASVHDDFRIGRRFAVNMLAENQQAVSNRFASSVPDRFADVAYAPGPAGSPLLTDAMTAIECRTVYAHDGGDHTIFVGEVEFTRVTDAAPLAYCGGKYVGVTPLR